MKTLLILRHAKSDWNNANLSDFDRPLNERGLRDAPRVGKLMRDKDLLPDLILSSPAVRARETLRLAAETAAFGGEIRFEPRIYEASINDLLEIAAAVPDDCEKLLIVGHNPGFSRLVEVLTGESENLPTAALAEIVLPIENWSEIKTGAGELKNLFKPKEIAN